MKLNSHFLLYADGGTTFVVSTGETAFNGLARGNATAGFIIHCLKNETTEDEIVANMQAEWDVSEAQARRDVQKIVGLLQGLGAIDP